jgi:fibronectin-binding autotransporter adhesin
MGSGSAPGGFTLNAGTVITGGNNGLGNGLLTINGGTWESSGTRDYNPSGIAIGGDFTLTGTGNAILAKSAGGVALGASTRTITNSTTSGSRQFTGIISGGSGAGLTFAGTGGAQIYIGNTGNTFDGPIAINGGEVVFNGNGAFGSTTSITIDGGRLTMGSMIANGTVSALTAATIASTRNIFVGAGAGTSISVSGSTGVTTYNGVIADKASATGAWAKQGAGRLELGGVSTYTGDTAINNGTVRLTTGNNRLPTGTTVSLGQTASANLGIFDLNGFNQEIAGLNATTGTNLTASDNTVTSASAATLTISGSGTYSYGDGTNANSGVITGSISLVKSGSGTQTLGDVNTYTGTTSVNGGKLIINGNNSAATGAVSVNNTGTLGGTGTIGGAVTVNAGGTINPGASVGTLTLNSTATFVGTDGSNLATYAVDILGATSDKLVITGALALSNSFDQITFNGTPDGTTIYVLATYSSFSGTFDFGSAPSGYQLIYGTTELDLAPIPEPSTWVAGALALGVLGWSQRRRLRSLILHRA